MVRRYAGQKALYEAMSRSHSKSKRPSMLARLRPQLEKLRPQLEKLRQIAARRPKKSVARVEPAGEKPVPMVLKPPRPAEVPRTEPQGPAQRWLRPKAVQFNDGRIEVSLSYQIGIIIVLGVMLFLMMGFWFGRRVGRIDERSRYNKQVVASRAEVGGAPVRSATPEPEPEFSTAGPPAETPSNEASVRAAPVRTGDNVIVLARHTDKSQLEPVQAYFREHGVETRILSYDRLRAVFEQYGLDISRLPKGDGFMLVTNDLYENPGRKGTNGYAMIEKIKELGRGYQAPPDHERFAVNFFSDAYGLKIAK